jgi:hypothetical protein
MINDACGAGKRNSSQCLSVLQAYAIPMMLSYGSHNNLGPQITAEKQELQTLLKNYGYTFSNGALVTFAQLQAQEKAKQATIAKQEQAEKQKKVDQINANKAAVDLAPTKPTVDGYAPDLGNLTMEQLYARAAANGLTPSQLDDWMKTLPTQDQVCSGLVVSSNCGDAYLTNMQRVITAYPGVPVSELRTQLETAANLSRKGDDSFGKLAWDAAGTVSDMLATSGYKPAVAFSSTKTITDLSMTAYDAFVAHKDPNSPQKFAYDLVSEASKRLVERVIKNEYPNFDKLPEKQKQILIQSVLQGVSAIHKLNEPN